MDKEICKWILDSFPDERIAGIAEEFKVKIPGFRQLNPQHKTFKMVRPKIIQNALQQRNAQKLIDFISSVAEEQNEIESLRGKSVIDLQKIAQEEIQPSILLCVLLSSEVEEEQVKAEELYSTLKAEEKLEILENLAVGYTANIESENVHDSETWQTVKEELKSAQLIIDKLEKRLKKFEQKNEELKSKEAITQVALQNEKKRAKELSQEINVLKGEIGIFKHQIKSYNPEKELLQKKMEKQAGVLKTKTEEISRLHALVLKLNTDLDKLSNLKEKTPEAKDSPKLKVALIGDPKNIKILKYHRYELTIIEGADVRKEEIHKVLNSSDQIWLLTYKIPRSIQKSVSTYVKGKQMKEFATFIDLESYMLKGMI